MASYAAFLGVSSTLVGRILTSSTSEEALQIIEEGGIDVQAFLYLLARRIHERCFAYTGEKVSITVILFTRNGMVAEVA